MTYDTELVVNEHVTQIDSDNPLVSRHKFHWGKPVLGTLIAVIDVKGIPVARIVPEANGNPILENVEHHQRVESMTLFEDTLELTWNNEPPASAKVIATYEFTPRRVAGDDDESLIVNL